MATADYDIFRERLAIKYPSYGHALWVPSPRNPDRPVHVGDVGFIRQGSFYRLFNALLPADDPSHELGVPEYHEPLVPNLLDHLHTYSLNRNNYCSAGVRVEPDPGYHARPGDFPQVSFQCIGTRRAAVSSLPVSARREDTLSKGAFMRWIVKHIDNWLAFARRLELGIENMEEIILVTGCDLTRSWTNIAFFENEVDAQVSFGVRVEGPTRNPSVDFQFLPENARGAVLRHGPEGANLPENQCVFIRGFRATRSLWGFSTRLRAAAGPSDPGDYVRDPDTEVVTIPVTTKYRDPLHVLFDCIAKQAPDCDMMIVHDDNLVAITGIGHDTLPETLEPDVMMELLWRSKQEIHQVLCDLSSNTYRANVKVAMLSMTSQNQRTANLAMHIRPTSDRLLVEADAVADALLKEASTKVHEYQSTLSPESYNLAQGLLEYSKDFRSGLEDKDRFSRYQQVQEYLKKAKETHRAIMELTLGLY